MKITALAVQHRFGCLAPRIRQSRPDVYDMERASCLLISYWSHFFLGLAQQTHLSWSLFFPAYSISYHPVNPNWATNDTPSLQLSLHASDKVFKAHPFGRSKGDNDPNGYSTKKQNIQQ